jgi:hypothetical protein
MQIRSQAGKTHISLGNLSAIGTAVPARVVGYNMIFLRKFVDLSPEKFSVGRPTVDENKMFSGSALLIINFAIIGCGKVRHLGPPLAKAARQVTVSFIYHTSFAGTCQPFI